MQWSLFVLILMGQCSFSTCHLYEYHFIREGQSWEEAQSYCREHFTDLATVSDMRDVERLTNPPQTTDAWIGLRSINERDIKEWHWSLSGEKYIPTECEPGCEPEWAPDEKPFYCYDDKEILIKEKKTWDEALDYCRANHRDLCCSDGERWKMVQKADSEKFNFTCAT
ncbi:hypothetical protein KUCAC02_000640 [Chaenocephalus aceratus]|uniref:Uncharacterized protein n=1 Tax=Chaenocephalus aceratus TaxID=36190 RepID=A0ACB9W665_CHAAC|nr:hypothetical protein KUCAC02_000640 [Chaenocephalus aceratus]